MKRPKFDIRCSIRCVVVAATFLTLPSTLYSAADLALWYERPAAHWVEALPLGNGRLGAMVYGGVTSDTLQLNEDTFWSGSPYNNTNPNALSHLWQIRDCLDRGEWATAQQLAMHNITADRSVTGHGMMYESVGNLILTFPASHATASSYRRSLDIGRAVAATSYEAGGVTYTREAFTSLADDVTVVRLSASRRASLSLDVTFCGPPKRDRVSASVSAVDGRDDMLRVYSRPARPSAENIANGLHCVTYIRVAQRGGRRTTADGAIRIDGADEVVLVLSSATNFVDYTDITGDADTEARRRLDACFADGSPLDAYGRMLSSHVEAYREQFDRVSLDLGHNPEQEAKPTDVRIREFSTSDDPSLAALYFQYGRYLLVSSSQPGTQPANLQGIWNPDAGAYPAWDSKYTTNINVEMNYWPAEVTNLSELHEPFLQMVRDVSITGRQSARTMYGARGWTLHHNTDLWRSTGAVDYAACSVWPTAGAWFCSHVWERWLYTGNRGFLRYYYPVLRSAAEFYVDFLTRDPRTGYLVVSPSTSPENNPGFKAYHDSIFNKDYKPSVFAGVAMDNQMVYDLLTNTAEAARILRRDSALADTLDALRRQLPPMMVGRYGQLQEWLDDWDRETSSHRHVSHLWAAYPGRQVSPYEHPELAAAVRKSLEGRGDASRGWSMGWKVCLWARLLDGNHAYRLIQNQLKLKRSDATIRDQDGGTYANMMDAHPPFQIDGNFGCTAGIAEMLVQSHDGCLHLLPALPDAWPNGRVAGLRARGGYEVCDMQWRDGSIVSLTVKSYIGSNLRIRSAVPLQMADGTPLVPASGRNPNRMMQTYDVLSPVVRDSSALVTYLPPATFTYDIPTQRGKTYTLVASPRDWTLHVSANHRYLCHADGTPFYWQGETAWLLPTVDDTASVEFYLRRCREEGYNVVQVQTVSNIRQMDSVAYWQNLDDIVRRAERNGIYVGMVCIWGGMVKAGLLDADGARRYGQFLAERYGDSPNIIWIIGGDQPGTVHPEVWEALATSIKAADSRHLMTYHPRGRTSSVEWWNTSQWLDINMFQSGHRRYGQVHVQPNGGTRAVEDAETLPDDAAGAIHEDNWRYVETALAAEPLRPVLDGEPSYERIPQGLHNPAEPQWTAADCRRYAWWSVMAGACGHTYGNNAIMQFYDSTRADGRAGAYGCTTDWRTAVGDDGFRQMKFVPRLLQRLPYMERVGDQSVLVGRYGERYNRPAACRGRDYIVVYTYTGQTLGLDLDRIAGDEKRAWWYSPTDGSLRYIGRFATGRDIRFMPPTPAGDGHDQVLVVTDAEAHYFD